MKLRVALLIAAVIATAYGGYVMYSSYAFLRDNTAGRRLLESRLYDSASIRFRQAIATQPSRADVHDNLGTCLFVMGDRAGGIAEFRLSLQLDPWSPGTHFNLAQALYLDGHSDESIREAEAALRWADPMSNEAKRIEAFLADPALFMATTKHD